LGVFPLNVLNLISTLTINALLLCHVSWVIGFDTQGGGGGVKKWQNSVHVVVEYPLANVFEVINILQSLKLDVLKVLSTPTSGLPHCIVPKEERAKKKVSKKQCNT
jgi:hypothetical protein